MQLVVFQFSEQAICNDLVSWHFASHKLSMSPPIAGSHWTSNLQSSVQSMEIHSGHIHHCCVVHVMFVLLRNS